MSQSTKTVRVGPFGNQNNGDPWDDGFYGGIKKIELSYGTLINSIRFTYVDNHGKEAPGPKHGESDGDENHKVTLDPKNEKIIKVTGYTKHSACGTEVVVSLKFQTTKKAYGPFGPEEGNKFIFPTSNGYVVGFHGRADTYLNAIGANVVESTI